MRILIAEDDAVSRRILEAYLRKWGHDVVVSVDGAEAWHVFSGDDPPRLAVLDWMMPNMDGVEVCRKVRARENSPFTYIILLTAKSDTDDIVTALDAGADDYLVKPYNASELRSRIGAGERILRLHEALEKANSELVRLAETDSLTQVYNRSAIIRRLNQELARAARENHPLAMFLFDVDHFKAVNDTHGHAAGDKVLVAVADCLKHECRSYDVTGRYGGEEFIMIVPGPAKGEVEHIGERLRAAIEKESVDVGGATLHVTASIGGIWVEPGADTTVDDVFKHADELLYRAKREGRNRVITGVLAADPSPLISS